MSCELGLKETNPPTGDTQKGEYWVVPLMAGQVPVVVSCELGLIETTEPTEGTQHSEYWGGPTNGQAAACRRRPRR